MTNDRKAGKPSEPKRDAGCRHSDALPITLNAGDRYHRVIEARNILGDRLTGSQSISAFFVIERCDGSRCDVYRMDRTARGGDSITRVTLKRHGVPLERVETETASVLLEFSTWYEDETGYEFEWDNLELEDAFGDDIQAEMLAHWNGIGAMPEVASEMTWDFDLPRASGRG